VNRFPDFGKELQGPFEVHENCYDCAALYDGCQGWRASRDFNCRDFNRLPDVGIDGKHGQEFPPPRCRVQGQPEPEPIEQEPPESNPQTEPDQSHASHLAIDRPPAYPPSSLPETPAKSGARVCGCGAGLPKGRQLCDTCRMENRRRTKRRYMQGYMKHWRSGVIRSDSDVPFPAQSTHVARGSGEDRPSTRPAAGVPPILRTSVLTNNPLSDSSDEPRTAAMDRRATRNP
jgi:hypothetical protein